MIREKRELPFTLVCNLYACLTCSSSEAIKEAATSCCALKFVGSSTNFIRKDVSIPTEMGFYLAPPSLSDPGSSEHASTG